MARRKIKSGVGSASQLNQRYIAVTDEPPPYREVDLTCNSFSNETVFSQEKTLETELNKIDTPIIDALENFLHNASVPLHIPGHARGEGVLPKFRDLLGERIINLDTTDEFDNLGTLHPATGPIQKSQELFASLYGASKTFFLVNGSTVGNLAIALTVTKENKKALDDAWAKGYSYNLVLMALRAEGIKSSNESIRAHKKGMCKCPKE